ncbi:MAG: hypothetical protein K2Q26_07855 [Bdellovibrionales bacterium]|nr:hypothetical protein [Bdellovibrionales bacterium]
MSKESYKIDANDNYTDLDIFIEQQNHCCLCLNELHFDHQMDYGTNTLTETATCGQCNIKVWESKHSTH